MPQDVIQPNGVIGRDIARGDGPAKVTGEVRYPSDESVPNPAWAFLVTSAIARGRVTGFRLDEARAVPGVLDILTHANTQGQVKPLPPPKGGGHATTTMESDRIWHEGQIIAVVLAESFEAAREAAYKVRTDYAEEPPAAGFGSPGAEEQPLAEASRGHEDPAVGEAERAFAAAVAKVDARYGTPTQHHNPIELFATTCAWSGGTLTIHESSQFVHGLAATVAHQLGMDPKDVRVVSHFVGGAFGSRGQATGRTAWIALAARRLGRPVKLVATREQGFSIATYRAETRHHVKLGAGRDGRLQALVHEGWEVTSRTTNYTVTGTETTARIYACPNVATRVSVVHADRNTPGFMRAPPETPYAFALESAMDELAVALDMDPVELRRRNDTDREPIKGLPYTSRSLVRCLEAAAQAFGWSRRDPRPGAMREGDWLLGWGCAAAYYPAKIGPSSAQVLLMPDGTARVRTGAHEIGTGTYTVVAQTAADRLGLDPGRVAVEIGDSSLPAAGLSAGSSHASAVLNTVALACEQLRARLAQAAVTANEGPLAGRDPSELVLAGGTLRAPDGTAVPLRDAMGPLGPGPLDAYAEHNPHGAPPDGVRKVQQGEAVVTGGSQLPDRIQYAFGAQFVEVRVHARTREIRVPRMVGAFAAGRIVNPRTARSQLMGGMIWGLGAALHEVTEIDTHTARYANDNISEYLIPVNADVPRVEVMILPEEDRLVNPLGIKGVGELGIVGVNAAIANAVFHATGRRVRELPIRVEDLL